MQLRLLTIKDDGYFLMKKQLMQYKLYVVYLIVKLKRKLYYALKYGEEYKMNEEYEAVFIIKNYKDEEKSKDIIEKINEIVLTEKCEIIEKNDMGTRKLPFKINQETIGNYYIISFRTNGKRKNAKTHIITKINTMEEILEHIIIKKDI